MATSLDKPLPYTMLCRSTVRAAPPRLSAGNRQSVQPGQCANRLSVRADARADRERRPVVRCAARARVGDRPAAPAAIARQAAYRAIAAGARSEEHTSELQSLMRISYAVFCLKKKKKTSKSQTQVNKHDTIHV